MLESCNLCFKVVSLTTAVVIDKTLSEIFETLLMIQNLASDKTAVICESCNGKVENAFLFKSKCLETEDSLVPHISNKNGGDLSNSMQVDKDLQVCRLCKNFVGGNIFVKLKEMLQKNDMLEIFKKYMPEINLEAIKDHIICGPCQKSMKVWSSFIRSAVHLTNNSKNSYIHLQKQPLTEDDTASISVHHEMENGRLTVAQTKTETFQCDKCSFETISPKELNRHLEHHVKVKFECQKCPYETKLQKWLQKHMLKVHSEHYDYFHKCSECNYQTKHWATFKKHLLQHKHPEKIPLMKCQWCDYKAKRKDSLDEHVKVVHNKIKEHQCNYCNYQASTAKILRRHMLCIHNHGADQAQTFKCHLCDYATMRKDTLKRHMIKHQNMTDIKVIKCHLCDYQSKYGSLNSHMIVHLTEEEHKIYKCDYCSFKTNRKNALKNHRLIHDQQAELFKCDNCTFKTRHKHTLKTHIQRVHSRIKNCDMYRCNDCFFVTKHHTSLENHMLSYHSKVGKRFNCHECHYDTNLQKHFFKHMEVHRRNKRSKGNIINRFPFPTKHGKDELLKCYNCNFETRYKQNLRNHMDVHKKIKDNLKYKCTKCTFNTKYKLSFKMHFIKKHCQNYINENQKLLLPMKKEEIKGE